MGEYQERNLTCEQFKEVRSRLISGDRIPDIARDLGVSRSVIYDIKNGVTYKEI